MRSLLTSTLICISFTTQSQALATPPAEEKSSPCTESTASQTTEQSVAPEHSATEHIIKQFPNPYSPASATNFDPFAVPLAPYTETHDHSRQNRQPDNSGPIDAVYGHFDNPLFPDSIANRGETAHPFPLDSSTNLFGRNRPIQERARY